MFGNNFSIVGISLTNNFILGTVKSFKSSIETLYLSFIKRRASTIPHFSSDSDSSPESGSIRFPSYLSFLPLI